MTEWSQFMTPQEKVEEAMGKKRASRLNGLRTHARYASNPWNDVDFLLSIIDELTEEIERLKAFRNRLYDTTGDYEIGNQPCNDFKPKRESNGHGAWDNRHECPGCCGLRSWCESCSSDHHAGGWENCAAQLRGQVEQLNVQIRGLPHADK